MIIGDVNRFAIESQILEATEDEHFPAFGMFVIHVLGNGYGVRDSESNSFCHSDDVNTLVASRGTRIQPRLAKLPALDLAEEYLDACYRLEPKTFPESEQEARSKVFRSPCCYWPAPDEAFDDGTHILLFDIADHVRVVSFINGDDYQVERLADLTIQADEFYEILASWHSAFFAERARLLAETKIAE